MKTIPAWVARQWLTNLIEHHAALDLAVKAMKLFDDDYLRVSLARESAQSMIDQFMRHAVTDVAVEERETV